MAAFPEIPAKRLVLEDRAPVIEEVIQANEPGFEEVKKIPHDFFKPNPVKGETHPFSLFTSLSLRY